jgi:hypothetical protein
MNGIVWGAIALALSFATAAHAQAPPLNDIKTKIFDAQGAQRTLGGGLKYCNQLDGTNFYFQPRDRVLKLEDYHPALDNMVKEGVFNPESHRPWTADEAAKRWEQVKQQAVTDKSNCALAASLPFLQKKLDELEKAEATENKN